MTKEQKRLFVKFVKESAPWKAFSKTLGLTKEQYKFHLGKLVEYEKELEVPPVLPKLKLIKKAEVDKVVKRFDDKIVSYTKSKKKKDGDEENKTS